MGQMTEEQRRGIGIVAERVATKLTAFYGTLPPEEQDALALTLTYSLGGANGPADDSAGYAAQAVAAAFAAQNDVHGQAMMIGGEWFTPMGDPHLPQIPPKYGPFGRDIPPPRTPPWQQAGEPRDD